MNPNNEMVVGIRFTKGEEVRFLSHLDMQRTLQRIFRRSAIPLGYSQGFNPHILLSLASALSVGTASDDEWLELELAKRFPVEEIAAELNKVTVPGISFIEAVVLDPHHESFTASMRESIFEVQVIAEGGFVKDPAQAVENAVNAKEIIVPKKTKGGIKDTDIRPMFDDFELKSYELRNSAGDGEAVFTARLSTNSTATLNPRLLAETIFGECVEDKGALCIFPTRRRLILAEAKQEVGSEAAAD